MRGNASTSRVRAGTSSATPSRTSRTSSNVWAACTVRVSNSSATTSAICTASSTSWTAGLVKGPLFVQFVMGILGGIGADPENLGHMKRIADKLFGDGYRWSVLGAGRHQMPLATQAALMGGNVRVGLEDALSIGPGRLATSNAEQVRMIRGLLESLGLEIATPDEARQMLGLKGRQEVRLS